MIGGILGAGVGLAQAFSQRQAQQDQLNLEYQNLFEQRRQAREREELAKATRSDAFGNKVRYVQGQGFVTEVTPLTSAILNSQQKEQLAQFRDDAPRARQAAERIDKRSRQAGEVFDEKFNKYRYQRQKSEEEYVAEAIRNAISGQRERGDIAGSNEQLSRAVLRANNPSVARNIYAASRERSGSTPTLSETIANAKREGTQRYFAERGARNSSDFGELDNLRSIADNYVAPNLNFNNENALLSERQDNALQNLITTNANNSQAVGNAFSSAAQAAGAFPNFSGIAAGLSGLDIGGKRPPKQSEQEKLLADLLVEQQIGALNIGINSNNKILSQFKGNSGAF